MIVATGASALWLGLDSETRLRGRGVSACATCDGFFFRDKEIAVVGGGDTALEEATFLTRFATKVNLLHRRDAFRGQQDHGRSGEGEPEDRDPDEHRGRRGPRRREGRRACGCATRESGETEDVDMEGLFIAIGYRPNTEVFRDWLEVDEKGYLVVRDETGSKIEGVFIAGDVHDHRYRQAVTAAGDGCKAAIDAERWLESQGIAEAQPPPGRVVTSPLRDRRRVSGSGRRSAEIVRRELDAAFEAAGAARLRHGRGRYRRPRRRLRPRLRAAAVPAAGSPASSAPISTRRHQGRSPTSTSSRRSTSAPTPTRFPAGTFDVILSSFTVEHFADPAAAVRNMRGWLRPGGHLVISTVNRRHPFVWAYMAIPARLRRRLQRLVKATAADAHPLVGVCNTVDEIRAALAAAGFTDVRVTTRAISPVPGAATGRRGCWA